VNICEVRSVVKVTFPSLLTPPLFSYAGGFGEFGEKFGEFADKPPYGQSNCGLVNSPKSFI